MEENRYKAAIGYILKTSEEDNYLLELINGGYWLSVFCYCDLRERYAIFLSEYFNLLRSIGFDVDKYYFDKIYYIYADKPNGGKLLCFNPPGILLPIFGSTSDIKEYLEYSDLVLFFETRQGAEDFLKNKFISKGEDWEVKEYKPRYPEYLFKEKDCNLNYFDNMAEDLLLKMEQVYFSNEYKDLFKNKVKY